MENTPTTGSHLPWGDVGTKPKQFGEDRTCLVCSTIVSRYNPKDTCYVHTPVKFYTPRGRRKRNGDMAAA